MALLGLWPQGIYFVTFASNPLRWSEKSSKLPMVPKAFTFRNMTRPITPVMGHCRKPTTSLFEAAWICLEMALRSEF